MIEAPSVVSALTQRCFNFFTGVPCSFLTPLINCVISDSELPYVGASNEGEAVAIAAGACLAGRKTVVICQNSGLGNMVNHLTSLNQPFRLPTLLIVTWRGEPGLSDEPQHKVMGETTQGFLTLMGIPHREFPDTAEGLREVLMIAESVMENERRPFALILRKDVIAKYEIKSTIKCMPPCGAIKDTRTGRSLRARYEVLQETLHDLNDDIAVIATTGKCGRELFTLADRKQHFYLVGSMGGAAPTGLGVALHRLASVIVLDGDGAALMNLGAWATIGSQAPKNFVHVVLDNQVHDSTGGQPTTSPYVDFGAIAQACSYRHIWRCDDLDNYRKAISEALLSDGPALIHMKISQGSLTPLGRPTVSPDQVGKRFSTFLKEEGVPLLPVFKK